MNERGRTGLVATLLGIVRRAVNLLLQLVDWIVSITIRRPPSRCAEIDDLPEGYHPNPVQCNTVNVTLLGPGGGLIVYPGRSQPETLVKRQGGNQGLRRRLATREPLSALVEGGRSRRSLRSAGADRGLLRRVVGRDADDGTDAGRRTGFTFAGSSIDRIVVTPSGDTLVVELCH